MEKSSSFHFDKYFRVATQFVESALWLSLPPHTSIDQLWALGLTSPLTWRGSVATDSTLAHKSTNWELIRSCIRVIIVVVAFCALAAVCRWSQEADYLTGTLRTTWQASSGLMKTIYLSIGINARTRGVLSIIRAVDCSGGGWGRKNLVIAH